MQRCSERSRRAATACGLGLGRGGRPSGEIDDVEPFGCPAIGIRARRKSFGRARQRIATEAASCLEQVAARHPAHIRKQPPDIAITHRNLVGIGNGQSEPGALEKIAAGSNIDLRMYPGCGSVALRLAQHRTQCGQAASADKGPKKQSIWPKNSPDQRERARQIVDGVENACRDDKIECAIAKGQPILIALHTAAKPGKAKPGIDSRHTCADRRIERAAATAEIEYVPERSGHAREPFHDPTDHDPSKEIVIGIICRDPVTPQPASIAIENFHTGALFAGHLRACADAGRGRQGAMRLLDLMLRPLRLVADIVIPARCPGCGMTTGQDHRFCANCWGKLRFIAPPWCATCNMPLPYDAGADMRCAACLAMPPRHGGVRAAVAYGDIARSIALRLKYGGRVAYAETIARHLVRLMPADAEVLVPVPLHPRRLWGRGFNQAALIAQALSRFCGTPCALDFLRRTRSTPLLRGLGKQERKRAVARAFAVTPAGAAALRGKSVVLVDDIYTSGATTDGCVDQLLRAGAARVTILCWARVITGGIND